MNKTAMEREKPIIAFFKSLIKYLEVHGVRILSLAQSVGQDIIKIGFHGIYRHHDETSGYHYFIEIVQSLSPTDLNELKKLGIEIYYDKDLGDHFIKMPLKTLKCLIEHKDSILKGDLSKCY